MPTTNESKVTDSSANRKTSIYDSPSIVSTIWIKSNTPKVFSSSNHHLTFEPSTAIDIRSSDTKSTPRYH